MLPGSRATVADLAWLRDRGLADAVAERARAGRPVLGICGGYQMLAGQIEDPVESRRGPVDGLGLLPVRVRFGAEKILGRPRGRALGAPVAGYEIHHGVAEVTDPAGSDRAVPRRLPPRRGVGHQLARRAGERRVQAGVPGRGGGAGRPGLHARARHRASPPSGRRGWTCSATWSPAHLDTAALSRLIEGGPVPGLPALVTSLNHDR